MDQSRLRSQLRDLEHAAQIALAGDASFLEALQTLRRLVDSDARVRAAMRALKDLGLSVYSSFVPRVHVWLQAGETALRTNLCMEQNHDRLETELSDSRTRQLRDAASSAIAASPHFRQLQRIVNEAVHASDAFERLASTVERPGFELQICLDLSTYAQVRERKQAGAADHRLRAGMQQPMPLSRLDVDFLKELRIKPD